MLSVNGRNNCTKGMCEDCSAGSYGVDLKRKTPEYTQNKGGTVISGGIARRFGGCQPNTDGVGRNMINI